MHTREVQGPILKMTQLVVCVGRGEGGAGPYSQEGVRVKEGGSVHRQAPIESVAMAKHGLMVMISKCPATQGYLIAKYLMYTDQVHISCKNSFQHLYSFFTAFNFPLEICLNMHSFELLICRHCAPYTSVHSCVRDTFWLMQARKKLRCQRIGTNVFCLV